MQPNGLRNDNLAVFFSSASEVLKIELQGHANGDSIVHTKSQELEYAITTTTSLAN